MATQLPELVARYVVAWCDASTKSASDSRSPRHAEALCALLRGLGRLLVPGVDLDALRAAAELQNDQNQRTPQPCSGDALLAESVSKLRTIDSGASAEAAADAQQAVAATEQRLAAAAAALPPAEAQTALQGALHASGRFQLLADSLLTVVAGEWLEQLPGARPLLDAVFRDAPAPAALTALVSHLALVQPEATLGSSAVRVAAVAADFAASALAWRFAAPGSAGIDELVAASAAGMAGADGAAALASVPDRAVTAGEASLRAESFVPHLVQRLVAAVEASAAAAATTQQQAEAEHPDATAAGNSSSVTFPSSDSSAALQPSDDGLTSPSVADGTGVATADENAAKHQAAAAAAAAAATTFAANVLGRLCRRGHAGLAAGALGPLLGGAAADAILAALPDGPGLERLLEALFRRLDGAPGSPVSGCHRMVSTAALSPQQPVAGSAAPAADGHDTDAAAGPGSVGSLDSFGAEAAALAALVQHHLWRHSGVRFLLADRLLLGLGPGGPLPLPALHLLVALLAATGGGSSSGGTDGSTKIGGGRASGGPASKAEVAAADTSPDGTLAAAALRAAQLWGDVGALRQLPPPRQVLL